MPSDTHSATAAVETHFARYSAGKSAHARNATVRATDKGVEISVENSAQKYLWSYASLSAAEPCLLYTSDAADE